MTIAGNDAVRGYALCSREGNGNVTLIVINTANESVSIDLSDPLASCRREKYLFTSDELTSSQLYLNGIYLAYEVSPEIR